MAVCSKQGKPEASEESKGSSVFLLLGAPGPVMVGNHCSGWGRGFSLNTRNVVFWSLLWGVSGVFQECLLVGFWESSF